MNLPDWLYEKPALPAEETFDRFVKSFEGQKISDLLSGNPSFQNADYLFPNENVIAELKTLQTDFGTTDSFRAKHIELAKKYLSESRMTLSAIFHSAEQPKEYIGDLLRLFRPSLCRILKKANRQLRDTKRKLNLPNTPGILLLINDDFLSLEPRFISSIIYEILSHSYSSIDACVYLTLNHYVDIPGNNYENLLWIPVYYSERSPASLRGFVNKLGSQWFQFLETETGEFDNRIVTDDPASILQAKAIPRSPHKS